MKAFFVQIKCELGKSYEVASALADAEIASEIYSTAGNYDLLGRECTAVDREFGSEGRTEFAAFQIPHLQRSVIRSGNGTPPNTSAVSEAAIAAAITGATLATE